MSTCIFINRPPYKNCSTCSQESHLSLWLPFLFVRVVNIRKTRAVLYCQFYETLNHTKFSKNLGNKGKLQEGADVCCAKMTHEMNIWGISSIELHQSRNGVL